VIEDGGETCKKGTVVIEGENFYLTVGKRKVQATVPRENSEDNRKLRVTVDALCSKTSELLELLYSEATTNE